MSRLLVYAGPNGAGKSSLRDRAQDMDAVDTVIDADRIARGLSPAAPRAVDREAGIAAIALFQRCLAEGQSMSLETTLAGRSVLRRLGEAKRAGYLVELRYVALDSVELTEQRVAARAALGGHSIEPDDIRRRYWRSLENLPDALLIADCASLIDNSGRVARPVLDMLGVELFGWRPICQGGLRG